VNRASVSDNHSTDIDTNHVPIKREKAMVAMAADSSDHLLVSSYTKKLVSNCATGNSLLMSKAEKQSHQLHASAVVRLERLSPHDIERLQNSSNYIACIEEPLEKGTAFADVDVSAKTSSFSNLFKVDGKLSLPAKFGFFACFKCPKKFISVSELLKHGENVHKEKFSERKILEMSAGCPNCSIKLSHVRSLRKHVHRCCGDVKTESKLDISSSSKETKNGHARKKKESCKPSVDADLGDKSQNMYCCVKCPRVFKSWKDIKKHFSFIHKFENVANIYSLKPCSQIKKPSPTCYRCKKYFSTWKRVYAHMRQEHKSYEIPSCDIKDESKSDASNTHNCGECPKSFMSKASLVRHMRKSHVNRITARVESRERNNIHRRKNASMYRCSLCTKVFGKKALAQRHLKRTHKVSDASTNSKISIVKRRVSSSITPYCTKCNMAFVGWNKLYRHIRTHNKSGFSQTDSNLQCSVCNIRCANQHALELHVKGCQLEKQISKCSISKSTPESDQVEEKKVVTKVYPCHLCGKVLSRTGAWYHMELVHNISKLKIPLKEQPDHSKWHIKPKCVYCNISYASFQELYRHVKICSKATFWQTKSKSLQQCPQCSLLFQDSKQLNFHKQHYHPHAGALKESPKGNILKSYRNKIISKSKPKVIPKCKICQRVFKNWHAVSGHMNTHYRASKVLNSLDKFYCNLCGLSFRNDSCLNNHKRHCSAKHSLEQPLSDVASTSEPQKKDEETQVAFKSSDSSTKFCIFCEFCEKEFTEEVVWFAHLSNYHRMTTKKCQSLKASLLKQSFEITPAESVKPIEAKAPTIDTCSRDQGLEVESPISTFNTEITTEPFKAKSDMSKAIKSKKSTSKPSFYCCHKCDFRSRYPPNLRRHYRNLHGFSNIEIGMLSKQNLQKYALGQSVAADDFQQSQPSTLNPEKCNSFSNASQEQDWANLPTDVETSSSSNSSTDSDEEIYHMKSYVGKNNCVSSSSSSSSDDSEDESIIDVESVEAKPQAQAFVEHSLLSPKNIVSLDQDIFHSHDSKSNEAHAKSSSNKTSTATISSPVSPTLSDANNSMPMIVVEDDCSSVIQLPTGSNITDTSRSLDLNEGEALHVNSTGHRVSENANLKPNIANKNPPVAVLRPFSAAPKNVLPSPCSFNVSTNNSSLPTTSYSISLVNKTVSSRIRTKQFKISYPIFIVDNMDFIIPVDVDSTTFYRRILLSEAPQLLFWQFANWYRDFSSCSWLVVALLSEPVVSHEQVGKLLKWLVEDKIATLPYSARKVPKIQSRDWETKPNIEIVNGYDTLSDSGICCFCGEIFSSAVCSTQKIRSTNLFLAESCKHSEFVRLSSPSSLNCLVYSFNPTSSPSVSPLFPVANSLYMRTLKENSCPEINNVPHHSKFSTYLSKFHLANSAKPTKKLTYGHFREIEVSNTDESISSVERVLQPASKPAIRLELSDQASAIAVQNKQPIDHTADEITESEFYSRDPSSKPYRCQFCNLNFLLWAEMIHHLQKMHKKCTLCKNYFKNRIQRGEHITNDHKEIICLACDHTCSTTEDVKAHIMQQHVNAHSGLFNCMQCDDQQILPEAIVAHLEKHDDERSLECSFCSKILPEDKEKRQIHFFEHSLSLYESYYCLLDDTQFLAPWALRRYFQTQYPDSNCHNCFKSKLACKCSRGICHIDHEVMKKVPSAKRNRNCTLCWVVLKPTENLRKHCDTQHPECLFQCEICGQRFNFDHHKKFHAAKHKRDPIYKYTLCLTCLRLTFTKSSEVEYSLANGCEKCAIMGSQVSASAASTSEALVVKEPSSHVEDSSLPESSLDLITLSSPE